MFTVKKNRLSRNKRRHKIHPDRTLVGRSKEVDRRKKGTRAERRRRKFINGKIMLRARRKKRLAVIK